MSKHQDLDERSWVSHDEAATEDIGARLVTMLPPDSTILLKGDLGAGKTVLVRGLSKPLGIDRRQVQSPSYALIHEYEGTKGRLVHVDLFRLEPDEVPSLGLDELLDGPGFKAIEWGERLSEMPPGSVNIRIEAEGESGARRITLQDVRDPRRRG